MYRNFKTVTNEINRIYKELIEYETKGIFPSQQFVSYFYSLVYHAELSDLIESEHLYRLHSFYIEGCVDESYNCIKNAKESDFLNVFNKQINKINFIIFHLYRGFSYLERFYTHSQNKDPLIEKSFKIFKNRFLVLCQENLFKALINYLLYNNNNLENEEIYRKVKKIFNLMNLDENSKLNIIKINNEIIWKNEVSNLSENGNKIFDNWFNNYFLKDISSYYKNKSKIFENLIIPELISSP